MVVVITAASSGFGRAAALAFAREGAGVSLAASAVLAPLMVALLVSRRWPMGSGGGAG